MRGSGRRGPGHDRRRQRRAGLVGAAVFVLGAAVPWLLWHGVISDIASQFRFSLEYFLSEWTPWVLLALGLICFVPVAWSLGRRPDSRWYPRARNAYAGWAVTLYLLGLGLGVQVAEIASPAG